MATVPLIIGQSLCVKNQLLRANSCKFIFVLGGRFAAPETNAVANFFTTEGFDQTPFLPRKLQPTILRHHENKKQNTRLTNDRRRRVRSDRGHCAGRSGAVRAARDRRRLRLSAPRGRRQRLLRRPQSKLQRQHRSVVVLMTMLEK